MDVVTRVQVPGDLVQRIIQIGIAGPWHVEITWFVVHTGNRNAGGIFGDNRRHCCDGEISVAASDLVKTVSGARFMRRERHGLDDFTVAQIGGHHADEEILRGNDTLFVFRAQMHLSLKCSQD